VLRTAMRRAVFLAVVFVAGGLWLARATVAEPPQPAPLQDGSSEADIRAALFGGVPGGRWKEGLLFEGIFPDYPNSRAPQFDFSNGQLVVPHPPTSREKIQEPFVREQQIDPKKYYPEGYHPELLEEWPVEGDLVVPWKRCRRT